MPANMTVAPVWRNLSEMPDSRMLEHDFTADKIEPQAVTVQVVPPLPPTVVVIVGFVMAVFDVVDVLAVVALRAAVRRDMGRKIGRRGTLRCGVCLAEIYSGDRGGTEERSAGIGIWIITCQDEGKESAVEKM
jgi:hypothetical protein